jgi:hypothetical protein
MSGTVSSPEVDVNHEETAPPIQSIQELLSGT